MSSTAMSSLENIQPENFDRVVAASQALSLLNGYRDEVATGEDPDANVSLKGRPGWFTGVVGLCSLIVDAKLFVGKPLEMKLKSFIEKFSNGNGVSAPHLYTQEEIGEANLLLTNIAYAESVKKINS